MYKVFITVALLAVAKAADYQATSFVSFNDNHNSVNHIQSALAPAKYALPAAPAYTVPTVSKVALPVLSKVAAPAYAAPLPKYSAPLTKVALPVVTKYAAAPVAKYVAGPSYAAPKEEYAPAKYEFAYVIEDPHTGDYHSQQEQRDGDHVVGQYSLHEADGTIRLVKYSDDGHGFNAVVEKQGEPTPAPVYKKVVPVAAPSYFH